MDALVTAGRAVQGDAKLDVRAIVVAAVQGDAKLDVRAIVVAAATALVAD